MSVVTKVGEQVDTEIERSIQALNRYLFLIILDIITDAIQEETLLAILFAHNLFLCDQANKKMEESLES